jgi:hypothetical protein
MRKLFLTAFVLAASLVVASSGLALEKTAARITDDSRDGWAAGTTCSVAYYNTCTGWVWIWSGWSPNDRVGVNFDTCGDNCTLESNWWYVWTAAPSGYGFTGTIDVFAADGSGCPSGAPLASQVFLPVSAWNLFSWGSLSVPNSFVVAGTFGPGLANPTAFASDHPAAGPTGPAACGLCYPTTRVNHSYYYGTSGSPLCPGSALNDGICDAQLFLDAQLTCTVAVEQESWGSVKNLYR